MEEPVCRKTGNRIKGDGDTLTTVPRIIQGKYFKVKLIDNRRRSDKNEPPVFCVICLGY